MRIFFIVALGTFVFLSASASAKPKMKLQPSPPASCAADREWRITGPINTKQVHAHAVATANPSTLYVQLDGGSAGAFFLLGPLGTAVSAANIKKKTKDQAVAVNKQLFVDPLELMKQALPAYAVSVEPKTPVTVTPFIWQIRPKKATFITRRLVLDISCDGWRGWYSYHLPEISVENSGVQIAELEFVAHQSEVLKGGQQLIRLFKLDASNSYTSKNKYILSSSLNPYSNVAFVHSLREDFEGKKVVLGQGDVNKVQYFLSFMQGVHVMEPGQVEIGKDW